MVKNLDGQPVQHVVKGETYLVPTVLNVAVVLPSHIDRGEGAETSKHWHTDSRWGSLDVPYALVDERTRDEFYMTSADSLGHDIMRDDGQEVVYQKRIAQENIIWPSGGVWSSVVWLYYNLGDVPAKDGHCAHHHTQLQECEQGGLICPAHGLRYKEDGSPRFKGPFYLRLQSARVGYSVRQEVRLDEPMILKIRRDSKWEKDVSVLLEDSNGELVYAASFQPYVGRDYIKIIVDAWNSRGFCPSYETKGLVNHESC